MALNGTMELIETVTVGSGGAASIEFDNIPATYTDLVIKYSARSNRASSNVDNVQVNINGQGVNTNITARSVYGDGSSAASLTVIDLAGGIVPASSVTASTFGNGKIYVPNYTSSANKSFSTDSTMENNATYSIALMAAGLWSQTAVITSIALDLQYGSFVEHSTATLYGISKVTAPIKATGGTVYDDADYVYHLFASSGTFTPNQALTCDVLVVAGGGGGGSMYVAGGGGAGGLRLLASQALTNAAAYTVTVGGGGAGGNSLGLTVAGKRGSSGSNSSFSGTGITTITTTGGGGGSSTQTASTGESATNGGSGGGATRAFPIPGTGNAGSYSPVEGYAGGNDSGAPNYYGGGGGGGSGQVGQNGGATSSGDGGDGTDTYNSISFASWLTATSTGVGGKIAGGGGGGLFVNGGTIGVGGDGGGGRGAGSSAAPNAGKTNAENGVTNTGSGGGGTERFGTGNGGSGGSGIVIVRYAK